MSAATKLTRQWLSVLEPAEILWSYPASVDSSPVGA